MKSVIFIFSFFLLGLSVFAGNIKLPLMGWSSWNAYMVNISDSIICRQADLMVSSGLRDKGYAQINIDDGFFGPRTSAGKMVAHPERFPNGMRGVVDYIHKLKMKAGIYSDAGINTCGSMYNKDAMGIGAGLYGHDIEDAELYFNEWDFDFIKIDYCGGRDAKLDPETRYRRIRKVVDSISHKPISINICRWAYPGTWVTEVGDSWRTTEDIRPNWKSISKLISKNIYLSAYCRDGHYNDLDMLAIGYEGNQSGLGGKSAFDITKDFLSADEEDAHFGMWCIMASPLLVGCKIEGIPQRSLDLLKNEELIALDQDPLGLQAYVVQHIGDTYVLVKDIIKREGTTRAVALYNPSDEPKTISVSANELGFKGQMKIRDLLRHSDLTPAATISLQVPAHGVQMLKVKGKREERSLYEAECGYMPKFTRIAGGPVYRPVEEASGRMVADNLGGYGNIIMWDDVYSLKGGTYTISISTQPTAQSGEVAPLRLSVNNQLVSLTSQNTATIQLNKGYNTVSLSSVGNMPAIDCFRLEKK